MDYRPRIAITRWEKVPGEDIAEYHRRVLEAGGALVNSRHHQAVTPERLAPRLEVVARSPDGLVEGVESPAHRWVVGVQWHPERPEPCQCGFADTSALLFQELVQQASRVPVRK